MIESHRLRQRHRLVFYVYIVAPPKIKREVKTDDQNLIAKDDVNETIISYRPKPLSDKVDELSSASVADEIQVFLEYVWSDLYWLATLVVLMTLFGCFFAHHADLRQRMVGARMRIACCSLIYRKVHTRRIYVGCESSTK